MNRKLLAIAVVPLIVGLSGAMAFSLFGSFTPSSVTVTAGTVTATLEPYLAGGFVYPGHTGGLTASWSTSGGGISPAPASGSCGGLVAGSSSSTWTSTTTGCGSANIRMGGAYTLLASHSGVYGDYDLGVHYLAPGEWIYVTFILHNNGNIPAVLFTSVVPATMAADHGIGLVPSGHLPSLGPTAPLANNGPEFQYALMQDGVGALVPGPAVHVTLQPGSGTELALYLGFNAWAADNNDMGASAGVTVIFGLV